MNKTFFGRYALWILVVIFFFVPFALRGARLALERMKNDVKDWLPDDFPETAELEWFRKHFLGEQFVVVTWEGCTGELSDSRFRRFVDQLFPPLPPSHQEALVAGPERVAQGAEATEPDRSQEGDRQALSDPFVDPSLGVYVRQLHPEDVPDPAQFIGNRLGLYHAVQDYFNWGGAREKWLRGGNDQWYYLTPNGDLFRWSQGNSILNKVWHALRHWGEEGLKGERVASLGPVDGPWYYADPDRLSARLFKSVTTGPGVLHQLVRTGGPLENDPATALERLGGTLFGPDKKQTCVVITLTEAAKQDLRRVLGRGILGKPRGKILEIAEAAGIAGPPAPPLWPPPISWWLGSRGMENSPSLKMGGPSVDNVAIDEEGQITLVRLVGLSVLLGITLSWVAFRSWNITVMIFFVGGVSAVASLSFVYWCGSGVDAVLMSMPSLVYVLGLSGAVHIINYYRDAVRHNGVHGAAGRAVQLGWKPCTMCAVTTALGLLSLSVSNILPIRKFGVFSALGIVATLGLLFLYLPSALELWPPKHFAAGQSTGRRASRLEATAEIVWLRLGHWIIDHYRLVIALSLIAAVGLGWGVTRINTDVQLLKMFDRHAKIIQDYRWMEQHLGKLVPMEVVIRVAHGAMRNTDGAGDQQADSAPENDYGLSFLERMEITEYVYEAIEQRFGEGKGDLIGRPMMAATFAPPLPPSGGGFRVASQRGGFSRALEDHRDTFSRTDYLRIDKEDGAELWRISLRLGALHNVDYGQFVVELKRTVEPILAAYRYRDEVLAKIERLPGRQGIRGARVYLMGVPFGASPSAREEVAADDSPSDASRKRGQTGALEQQQTQLFSRTLWRLLRNAGLSLRDWYDPRFEPPADWQKWLSQSDCVVLVSDSPNLPLASLPQLPTFVDARDHFFFDTSSATPTAADRAADVSAVYTGVVPIVYKAQRTLLHSLIESIGWAFVTISLVMIALVRGVRSGLVSMLPNVFPVAIVFGVMGWWRVLVDVGTMMTASVALGVAVDDTIHFLTWFRHGLDHGLPRKNAILWAYQRVAPAMTQTTAIGGLGLSIFALSTFTPTQRFGVLMLALLVAALIGDLILLPALLASPLGRVFQSTRGRTGNDEQTGTAGDSFSQAHDHVADSSSIPPAARPRTGLRAGDAAFGYGIDT